MSLTARKRIKVTKYFVWQMIFAFLGVMPCIRHIAFLQAMLNNVSYFAQALQVSQIICVFATKIKFCNYIDFCIQISKWKFCWQYNQLFITKRSFLAHSTIFS